MDIDLSTLDGSNGFTLNGISVDDYAGVTLSNAGDINGDGIDDILIGAYRGDPGVFSTAGESYIVFGSSVAFSSEIDLSSLNGSNGFRIDGISGNDRSGIGVSGAGDINGDGIDDIIIGADFADANGFNRSGEAYVIFGSTGGFSASINLAALNGNNGFTLTGIDADDNAGNEVSGAGDFNGDGFDDILIAASRAGRGADAYVGEVYIVFGKSTGFISEFDLSSLNGTNGFRLDGIDDGDTAGASVSDLGDVNGDGIDDIIIGATNGDPLPNAGESYVVFGSTGSFNSSFSLSALDGTNGFRIDGVAAGDLAGRNTSNAGDVNGDGINDILISALFANRNGIAFTGEAYVVYGSSAGFSSSFDLSSLDGTNGFTILGLATDDQVGAFISTAGDINADGLADILVGAPRSDPNGQDNPGSTYVIFGSSTRSNESIELSTLNTAEGFKINGVSDGDISGSAGSTAGDVNNDGIDDILVNAPRADANGVSNAGEVYVVFGTDSTRPEISAGQTLTLQENSAAGDVVGTVAAFDVAGVIDFTIIGGTGQAFFDIDSTGKVRLNAAGAATAANDFEQTPNAFLLTLTADDASGNTSTAGVVRIDITNDASDDPIARRFPDGRTVALTVNEGTAGVDRITGNAADELMNLRAGNDLGRGQDGRDQIFGGFGNDTLDGGNGADLLSGQRGNDRLLGREGNDFLRGDQDNDAAFGGNGADTVQGGTGDDRLSGGNGNDNVSGGDGNDTVDGNAGRDTVQGGNGTDTVNGGSENDNIFGNDGNDLIRGGSGNDIARGGDDDDNLFGEAGRDSLFGNDGNDRLFGAAENDVLRGGNGRDILSGGNGNDNLFGDAGVDVVRGDAGNDLVVGNLGNDFLFGGRGNDTLDGGDGADRLSGEQGNDLIRLGRNDGDRDIILTGRFSGDDTVSGFEVDIDKVDLSGTGITLATDLAGRISGGSNTVIDLGGGSSITLLGVSRTVLDLNDFIF